MFRRSAFPAAASLAVVLLAAAGCKIQVSGAAAGGGADQVRRKAAVGCSAAC